MRIIQVTDAFAVSSQVIATDMVDIREQGFTTVINNRPDSESGHSTASLRAAAEVSGLQYIDIPVFGSHFPAETIAKMQVALATHDKVLAFCRTGNRSINAWARAQSHVTNVAALVKEAGFSLFE